MQFTINRARLKEALTYAAPIASKKHQNPVMTTVKILATDKVVIEATDLEQRIAVRVTEDVEVIEQGQLCLPAKLLLDYVKELPFETLKIAFLTDKNQVRLSAGRSRVHLNVMDPSAFPADSTENAVFFNADGLKLIGGIKRVKPVASTDITRLFLMTVCISDGDIVATDGHRMSIVTEPELTLSDNELLIPKDSVSSIVKLFEGQESIDIAMGDNKLYFQAGNILFTTRLIAKNYPNYRAVVPQGPARTVKGNTGELLSAVKRLMLIHRDGATSKLSTIKMEFTQDEIVLTAESGASGEGAEAVAATTGFEDGTVVGLNGNYLKDALESLQEDTFELYVRNDLKPLVFKEGNYTHVLMPIKI